MGTFSVKDALMEFGDVLVYPEGISIEKETESLNRKSIRAEITHDLRFGIG